MEKLTLPTSYGTLHVYKQGNGRKKVVLLHGAGCDYAMLSWREVMQQFDHTYTVYAPDFLGYGQSDKPGGMSGEQFYDKHIASIKQLTDQLQLDRFVLAGLSMGGAIAIGFALQYPDKVTALIPVNTWGVTKKLPMHSISNWSIHQTNMTLVQYKWIAKYRWMAKWFIAYSLIGDKNNVTEPLIEEVLAACKGEAAGKSMQDFQRSSISKVGTTPFYNERLAQLPMPVIFVHGEKDPLVRVDDVIAASTRVQNGEYCVLEGCKHWSVKERPQQFFDIVQASFKF